MFKLNLSHIWTLICEGELFANTAGGDFTPHVVTVNTGEVMFNKLYFMPILHDMILSICFEMELLHFMVEIYFLMNLTVYMVSCHSSIWGPLFCFILIVLYLPYRDFALSFTGCCSKDSFICSEGSSRNLCSFCQWSCFECYYSPTGFFWWDLDIWGMS